MPSDHSSTTPGKRPKNDRHNSTTSDVSQSPGDGHALSHRSGVHHKSARHLVSHGRGRNSSFGRTLSKINVNAANAVQHEEAPHSARLSSNGTPLLSPRPRPAMKRTQTATALSHKSQSHTALRKNHSSGQLHRIGSAKHMNKHSRPEFHRSKSQPDKIKHNKSPPPPTNEQQASVHFDVGDDDDEEEMEGVDDGWTEESASQSPNTTRENTRSNTRQNSVILEPEPGSPEPQDKEEPSDTALAGSLKAEEHKMVEQKDFAPPTVVTAQSSYQEERNVRPADADAVAKRLLQRNQRANPPPAVTEVSARANATPQDSEQFPHSTNGALNASQAGTPMISRFIGDSSAPGSNDGTPMDTQHMPVRKTLAHHHHESSSDIKRNQSAPNFGLPLSPNPSEAPGSGANTPGGTNRPSRTQQKLWLQRGLSNVEANSQQQVPGLLAPGRMSRGGTMLRQYEKIEKELTVVRRFRDPIIDSMERLRRMRIAQGKGTDAASDMSPRKNRRTKDGSQTPRPESIKSQSSAPSTTERSRVSFVLSTPGDDDDDPQPAWRHMTLEEIEEATIDMRRQMWELHSPGEAD